MSGRIFLNYRRTDADAWADRVYERILQHLPRENVFMDIDGNIPFGFTWADWLDKQVAECDLMLALIGRQWVAEFGARSAPGVHDFVRVEIESALARKIPVVPVFLGDAQVPAKADLPESVRPLLDLQAARLQRTTFEADVTSLIEGAIRSIKLARGEDLTPPYTPPNPAGFVKIDAPIIHGAKDGWFKPGDTFRDADFAPEMVVVPPGSFMMGSKDGEGDNDEHPPHEVTLAEPFAVSVAPITRGQFAAFIKQTAHDMSGGAYGWTGSKWKKDDKYSWLNPGFKQTDDHPVVCVNWHDAQAYIKWLHDQTGAKPYRLLSEAEWEYCCRATSNGPYYTGVDITKAQANFGRNENGTTPVITEPLKYTPNKWGLRDMHGNVWEWCEDNWHKDYNGDPPDDGSVWQGGDTSLRVARGGSWYDLPQYLRSANRNRSQPVNRYSGIGFRLARTLTP